MYVGMNNDPTQRSMERGQLAVVVAAAAASRNKNTIGVFAGGGNTPPFTQTPPYPPRQPYLAHT